MERRNKIIYWIATGLLAVGMMQSGIFAVLRTKQWAYAGLFFAMTGALVSHLVMGDDGKAIFGSLLQIILIILSWYFRPVDRKVVLSIKLEPSQTSRG